MTKSIKNVFATVVLGIALFSALVIQSASLAIAGIIIVMLSDRLPLGD